MHSLRMYFLFPLTLLATKLIPSNFIVKSSQIWPHKYFIDTNDEMFLLPATESPDMWDGMVRKIAEKYLQILVVLP